MLAYAPDTAAEAADPNDPGASLLMEAGLALLPENSEWSMETPLRNLGDQTTLKQVLNNLKSLYLPSHSLAEDILDNVTVGELVTHLDKHRVESVLNLLYKKERAGVIAQTRTELDALKDTVS